MERNKVIQSLKQLRLDYTEFYEETHDETTDALDYAISSLAQSEENILKFYYVESEDDYWIGQRKDTLYYARWNKGLSTFVWSTSRYLPWGEHITAPKTLWKEYTYPSEPKEIPFIEWLNGFLAKYFNDKELNNE